jgi:putative tryptophan/tyrosine transport system substrate-binding protein
MTAFIGRRDFITLLGGAAAWPLAARAQQPKVWHVGFLAPVPPTPAMLSALRDGLRERGYVEGQNLSIDARWSEGSFEQNPGLAADLVRSNVDVIVAWSSPAVFAARRATSTIPILWRVSETRWQWVLLQIWRDRAATSPASATWRTI